MKVFFDSQPLRTGHSIRGIGSYTRNLLEALGKNKDIKFVESEAEADVVHYPYFDLFSNTLKLSKKPIVVTVFDVIPLIYPNQYPPGIKGKIRFLSQKKKLAKVDAVITISETSKKDIVRFLDIPQEKVFPIHLASSSNFRKMGNGRWKLEIKKKYNLPKQFVFYVGDVNYNKNVLGLAEACRILKAPLVIAGKQVTQPDFDRAHIENQPLVQLIKEYGNDTEITRLGFIPEEDLVKIYNLASVYCQPSFYEGFGLPVLEAMSCGVPVVASRTQSLVEIAEGRVVFVNPYDPINIAEALKNILNSNILRKKISLEGINYAKSFSWTKVAHETVQVYNKSQDHGR